MLVLRIMLIATLLTLTGCSEPFVGGFVAGVSAMEAMALQTQAEFNDAIAKVEAKKDELNQIADDVGIDKAKEYLLLMADPKTIENIEKLRKADWKDPKVAIGYGWAILASITAAYQKLKRKE